MTFLKEAFVTLGAVALGLFIIWLVLWLVAYLVTTLR